MNETVMIDPRFAVLLKLKDMQRTLSNSEKLMIEDNGYNEAMNELCESMVFVDSEYVQDWSADKNYDPDIKIEYFKHAINGSRLKYLFDKCGWSLIFDNTDVERDNSTALVINKEWVINNIIDDHEYALFIYTNKMSTVDLDIESNAYLRDTLMDINTDVYIHPEFGFMLSDIDIDEEMMLNRALKVSNTKRYKKSNRRIQESIVYVNKSIDDNLTIEDYRDKSIVDDRRLKRFIKGKLLRRYLAHCKYYLFIDMDGVFDQIQGTRTISFNGINSLLEYIDDNEKYIIAYYNDGIRLIPFHQNK